MAGRLHFNPNDKTPAPNAYKLPDTMGKDMKNIYANQKPLYSWYDSFLVHALDI